jgi:phospholipid transport system substrate-binding protein
MSTVISSLKGWRCVVVVASLLGAGTVAGAADSGAAAVVSRLDDTLIEVMKDGQHLGYEGRFQRLQPVMQQAFALDYMAEKSLGQRWNDLSEADRATWRRLFGEFTVANYAANFDRFTGQRFDILGEEASTNGTTLVKTKVVSPGTEDVPLTYRLQQIDGAWKIIDVFLKGTVSELALRRADYSSVLERDSFAALTTVVRGKIADLAAGRGKRERPDAR